ncbi:MAG: hypothetical protein ACOC0D_05065 [Spirochaeta sp.]
MRYGFLLLLMALAPATLFSAPFDMDIPDSFDSNAQRARILARAERFDVKLPEDQIPQLRIGFAEFSSPEGDDAKRIAFSLPAQLWQSLPQQLPDRSLSPAEISRIQQSRIESAIRLNADKVNTTRTELDDLLFSTDSSRAVRQKREDLHNRLNEQRNVLQVWQSLPLSIIDVARVKPLERITPGNTLLYPEHEHGQELPGGPDLLLAGRIHSLGEYFRNEIVLEGRYFVEPVQVYQDTLREEDISTSVPVMLHQVLEGLAGSDLAVAEFHVENHQDASVYVDIASERRTVAQNQSIYLAPGEYTITVVTREGDSYQFEREIAGTSSLNLEIPDVSRPAAELDISPFGVTVYRGALFEGYAPLELQVYSGAEILRLHREGYRERMLPLYSGDEKVSAELQLESFSLEDEVAASREDFYNALGMFALSVPLWVLSGAAADQIALLPPNMDPTSDMQRTRWGMSVLVSHYAFRGVSVALAVNTVFRLARYIRFAQAEHTGEY